MQMSEPIAEPTDAAQASVAWSVPARPAANWWLDIARRLARRPAALMSAVAVIVLLLTAALAPVVAPYDPNKQFRREGLGPSGQPVAPNAQFWLGTDSRGRDLLSRLIWGARVSLAISLSASAITVTTALLVGGLAGFRGGKTDQLVMRFVDLTMSVPSFFVMLLLLTLLEPSPWIVVLVIALFGWPYPSRIIRAEVLSLKERDFITAARCLGIPDWQVFGRHLLPHLLPLVIVYLALNIPGVIFAEAGLSFLGLGVQPPTPAWGTMIAEGQSYYRAAPWLVLFPGAAIMITVVAFNMLGSTLRELMDPLQRRG
jgi:peptide/nickel transport system permease protein